MIDGEADRTRRALAALAGASAPKDGRRSATAEVATAGVSAGELAALHRTGYQVVEVVVGSSVSVVRLPVLNRAIPGEVAPVTGVLATAGRTALSSLVERAAELGASGIVGASMRLRWRNEAQVLSAEVVMVGTAVRRRTRPRSTAPPFVAAFNAIDLVRLEETGWEPTGLAMGCSACKVAWQSARSWTAQARNGGEIPTFTEGLFAARELTMGRLQGSAEDLQAEGVVGIRLREDHQLWGSHLLVLSAMGTAVRRHGRRPKEVRPELTLSLGPMAGERTFNASYGTRP